MLKILIADDHAIVRRGIKDILAEEFTTAEFGEADSAPRVLDLARGQEWDILILDITLPGRSGLEVLKDIKREHPKLPVLILSMHSEDQFATRTLRAGAAGYLTKENASEELVKAIRKVLGGGRYVSSAFAERLIVTLATHSEKPLHEALSDREYQVMSLIGSGKTAKEIARGLSLSAKTISTYRSRLLEKMRMQNNAELTHYAISNQLVD
jgi:two-component system, NarL family, invasion response regulator UvrY